MESFVAENVRRLRKEAGLSQRALMDKSGTSAVKMIEAGHRPGSISSLQKIANALGVPLSRLFEQPRAKTKAG